LRLHNEYDHPIPERNRTVAPATDILICQRQPFAIAARAAIGCHLSWH